MGGVSREGLSRPSVSTPRTGPTCRGGPGCPEGRPRRGRATSSTHSQTPHTHGTHARGLLTLAIIPAALAGVRAVDVETAIAVLRMIEKTVTLRTLRYGGDLQIVMLNKVRRAAPRPSPPFFALRPLPPFAAPRRPSSPFALCRPSPPFAALRPWPFAALRLRRRTGTRGTCAQPALAPPLHAARSTSPHLASPRLTSPHLASSNDTDTATTGEQDGRPRRGAAAGVDGAVLRRPRRARLARRAE